MSVCTTIGNFNLHVDHGRTTTIYIFDKREKYLRSGEFIGQYAVSTLAAFTGKPIMVLLDDYGNPRWAMDTDEITTMIQWLHDETDTCPLCHTLICLHEYQRRCTRQEFAAGNF